MHDRRRTVTLWLSLCLLIVALDSKRVPGVSPILAAVPYLLTTAGLLCGLATRRSFCFRFATVMLVTVSIMRAMVYFLDDGRIAPFGLNGAIAILAVGTYLGRGVER